MLKCSLGAAALVILLALPSPTRAAPSSEGGPRVSGLYTTWDDYFFYAAVQVRDPHVFGVNTTPTSQPQQDDDAEVFFETDDARARTRTPQTYQMAVSAANGAYFSVGDGSAVPQAKAIFTYKYAANVDGKLNDPTATSAGYTIELAIPWQELGQSGPPKPGTVWGFNVISRDRPSRDTPADAFYSLSQAVKGPKDVQDPSKWTQIVFEAADAAGAASTAGRVVCVHTGSRFPTVDGVVASGEWPTATRLAFGDTAVHAPAPTVAEEPNTTASPFTQAQIQAAQVPPQAPPPSPSSQYPDRIPLPGGGSIKIVPGGIKNPAGMQPPVQTAQNNTTNPLTPKLPPGYRPPTPNVALTGSLVLGPDKPPALVMALYRVDYNGDGRKGAPQKVWDAQGGSLLVDQPMNGAGPWFSGLRALWHRQQLTDLRRAGVNVVLVEARGDDPLLGREMDAFVEALREMKAQGRDYPLVSVAPAGASLDAVYARIPAEFRAMLPGREGVFVYTSAADAALPDRLADGTPVYALGGKAAVVSPGGLAGGRLVARRDGQAYQESWAKAIAAKPDFVILDSWNDFTRGTDVAATRQYGESYADQTKVQTLAFNGNHEWHAKYLWERTPRVVRPKVLYQVPVRVENAGTLPWRAGEGYSLTPRWYKDGRLYDDSAPRIPLGVDLLPGQSATVSVGLVARNGYGDDLEPGQYTLVFDVVQAQDRWFSYAGDVPLQVPVTVLAAGAADTPQATFLSAATPVTVQAGATYPTRVRVRNDGAGPWPAARYTLAYKIQSDSGGQVQTLVESPGSALSAKDVVPGSVAEATTSVALSDAQGRPLPPGNYRLHWFVRSAGAGTPAVAGAYDEPIEVVATDTGASFILSDIPREVESGKDATALLAVQNQGARTWLKANTKVGYHWYYLDGVEQQWDGGTLSPLSKDVPVGDTDGGITAAFRAPSQPGRYALVFDVRTPGGAWASTLPGTKGVDLLQALVTVTGKGSFTTVDLSKATTEGSFDGQGHAFPLEMLPPDATSEVEANPLLAVKPGPPLYPSGFYASQSGEDASSNHRVPFLYPANNLFVTCQGQTLSLPEGRYKAVHVLMAAGGAQAVTADFGLRASGGQAPPQSLTVAGWGSPPTAPGATVAFRSAYRAVGDGAMDAPCLLGDYVLPLDGRTRVNGLVLPRNDAVKILAVTLER